MSFLEIDGLCVQFGGLRALSEFDMTVDEGSMVALIGPNGAGKTTAFNVITGVYAPTAGEVRLDGTRLSGSSAHQICARGVARTFQNIRLFRSLSVIENIQVALLGAERSPWRDVLRGSGWRLREQARRARAQALLEKLNLERFAEERSDSLPYGEQRRLEIARALATSPRLLLLDEPAAGANPSEKELLRQGISEVQQQFGLTVLLIDHDIPFVMKLCSRVTVLDHGEKIAEESPGDISRDPRVIEAYLGPDGAEEHEHPEPRARAEAAGGGRARPLETRGASR